MPGDYETNEKEAWVPSWYTRGQVRCGRTADWYFEIDNLEPWNNSDQLAMEHYLREGFSKWGIVEINETDQMVIYQRTGESSEFPSQAPTDDVPRLQLADFEARFDELATPDLPLTYPAVNQQIDNPLHVNFADQIWLEGFNIDYETPLRQGDTLTLTLFWRAQRPIDASYKVFNQSFYGDSGTVAQLGRLSRLRNAGDVALGSGRTHHRSLRDSRRRGRGRRSLSALHGTLFGRDTGAAGCSQRSGGSGGYPGPPDRHSHR